MRPVPVLFLIDQLCGMAGAERVLINMIKYLPKDQFRCLMATFKSDPHPEIVSQIDCPLHVFPLRRSYDLTAARAALRLRRLIRSEQVQIVHTFFETSDLWGGMIAKLSGCPILVSSRRDMGFNQSAKHRLAYRALRRLFDQVQAVSEQVRNACIRNESLAPDHVVTLYNGVEMDAIIAANNTSALRASMGIEGASHVLVSVGNIRRVKGTDLVIRAAAHIRRRYPRAVFCLIGKVLEPDYFQELQELTRSLNLTENVKFLGASDQVFSWLKISEVFCLLSRSEGFSNALLEAMACGLPCVVTDVGGNREAVEEARSGFLVASGDVETAAERILTLLDNPARAKEMGQFGRQIVHDKFTTDVMVSNLVTLYKGLLQRVH